MSNSRRVLIVGPVASSDGGRSAGGIAAHVSDLAREAAGHGWDVAVYADNVPATHDRLERAWGPLFVRPPLSRSPGSALSLLRPDRAAAAAKTLGAQHIRSLGQSRGVALAHVLGMRRAIRDFEPHVVHYHQADWRPVYGSLAGIGDLPAVITMHSLSRFQPDEPPGMAELVLKNLGSANEVLCVSEDTAAGLKGLAPDLKTIVVPNGIDLERFTPAPPPKDPAVLYLGRVVPEKGITTLLAAVAEARRSVPALRLMVAGPADRLDLPAEGRAADLDPEALEYLGPVAEDDVPALFARASVLAFPSIVREGQGRSILEAMATRVPVVASATGAVTDLLEQGRSGLLVPPGDAHALADALVSALTDDALRDSVTSAARETVQRFDLDRVSREILAAYDRAIDASGRDTPHSGAPPS
jgi:glycosyltransferase involved in cell wall biosynthesis